MPCLSNRGHLPSDMKYRRLVPARIDKHKDCALWLDYCMTTSKRNKPGKMKKLCCSLLVIAVMCACNNNESPEPGSSGPSTTNVQNVNGNQPDTSTGITLDNKQSGDTTRKDSLPR